MSSIETLYHFQLNVQRRDTHYKQNFTEESFDQFPYISVLVITGENQQFILVQNSKKAFPDPTTAAQVLVSHANRTLRNYGLELQVHPMLDKTDFWGIVDSHPHGFAQVEFTVPAPNLPRVKRTVTQGIQELEGGVKAQEAKLVITASKKGTLHLSQADRNLTSLVDSSKEGTPPPRLRPSGQRKWIIASGTKKVIRFVVEALTGAFGLLELEDLINRITGRDEKDDSSPKH